MIVGYRRFFVLACLGIAAFFCGCERHAQAPRAVAGGIDLTGWDFERDGVAKLAGQWALYPDQLLSPDELAGAASSREGDLVMPSFRTADAGRGGYFGGGEYATLRLRVRLPVVSTPLTLAAGFAAGANDYLAKPFSGQELIARVIAQLQLKTAFETLAENVRLKRELARRKETQQHLLLTQRRLSDFHIP